jgi:hypothetical protein
MPLRVVYISPLTEPPAFIRERWETEVRRIFGDDIEISLVSERHRTPDELARKVHQSTPDAVIGSAAPEHRRALLGLANETLILHPVTKRYRDHHGYPRERTAGFGVMREPGPALLADGALAERSAITEELARQKAQQPRREEQEH